MPKTTTALLARIAAEAEAARQAAWQARASGERKRPRWAVDHLLGVGGISAEQHTAAHRYSNALERSQPGGRGPSPKVDGSGSDPHARMWDASVAHQVVRGARVFVLRAPSSARKRMAVLDALFAWPHPTMAKMTHIATGSKLPYTYAVKRIGTVLDLLDMYFAKCDAES